jgi:hypothetical protein
MKTVSHVRQLSRPPAFRGGVHHINLKQVSGWCVRAADPWDPLVAEVVCAGVQVEAILNNRERKDLSEQLGRPTLGGFAFRWVDCSPQSRGVLIDALKPLDPKQPVSVAVRISGTAFEVDREHAASLGLPSNAELLQLLREAHGVDAEEEEPSPAASALLRLRSSVGGRADALADLDLLDQHIAGLQRSLDFALKTARHSGLQHHLSSLTATRPPGLERERAGGTAVIESVASRADGASTIIVKSGNHLVLSGWTVADALPLTAATPMHVCLTPVGGAGKAHFGFVDRRQSRDDVVVRLRPSDEAQTRFSGFQFSCETAGLAPGRYDISLLYPGPLFKDGTALRVATGAQLQIVA